MAAKKTHLILLPIVVSVVTSIIVSVAVLFVFLGTPWFQKGMGGSGTAKSISFDANFAKYERVINAFLDTIRKGEAEKAYGQTSPSFQKLTKLEDFKNLVAGYKESGSIPAGACAVTQYSDPFTTTITGLPDTYTIIQTKCEAAEKGSVRGFDVELIEDGGALKVSYINAYAGPVIHEK